MVQVGLNASNDVAPWEPDARPTVTACLQWNSDSSWDNVYVCANGTNNATFGFNNVNLYEFVCYHKLTERLWVATEDYDEYQNNGRRCRQSQARIPRFCPPPETQCLAGVYSSSLYIMYQLTDRNYIGLRQEAFDDVRGRRTGFASWYTETTLGWVHWLTPSIEVRREIRYDHSYQATAYDNGTKSSQFAFAADMIIKF